ncbi:hypothetical protein [Streptomyces sp. NPDC005732]|uniref:hypothetical protein n=1 Tax=Streptomyces sp. NPDC005732 TaxID=3157057 RepID=UPI0033EE54B1
MFNVGRPFRLHLPYQVLGGWELTDGQALVIDDGGYGITAASTAADLIRGYGGGQLEWLEQHHPTQHDQ